MTELVTRPTLEGTADLDDIREEFTSGYVVAEKPFETHAVLFDLVAEVEDLRAQQRAPALAAENQKLREALGALAKAIESYRSASAEAGNTMWPWPALDLALDSAAPLLEGEGASK